MEDQRDNDGMYYSVVKKTRPGAHPRIGVPGLDRSRIGVTLDRFYL